MSEVVKEIVPLPPTGPPQAVDALAMAKAAFAAAKAEAAKPSEARPVTPLVDALSGLPAGVSKRVVFEMREGQWQVEILLQDKAFFSEVDFARIVTTLQSKRAMIRRKATEAYQAQMRKQFEELPAEKKFTFEQEQRVRGTKVEVKKL